MLQIGHAIIFAGVAYAACINGIKVCFVATVEQFKKPIFAPAFGMEPCSLCNDTLHEQCQGKRYELCNCRHAYHLPCIYNWTLTKQTCPQCNARIAPVEIRLFQHYQNEQSTNTPDVLEKPNAAKQRTLFLVCGGIGIGAMVLYYFKDAIADLLWGKKETESPDTPEVS